MDCYTSKVIAIDRPCRTGKYNKNIFQQTILEKIPYRKKSLLAISTAYKINYIFKKNYPQLMQQ